MHYVIRTQHAYPFIADPASGRYTKYLNKAAKFARPGHAFEAIGRLVARAVERRKRSGAWGPFKPDSPYLQFEVVRVEPPVLPPPPPRLTVLSWDEEVS